MIVKMTNNSTESSLLYAARNGDIETVKSLVTALKEDKLSFDLNCTGRYQYTCVFSPPAGAASAGLIVTKLLSPYFALGPLHFAVFVYVA